MPDVAIETEKTAAQAPIPGLWQHRLDGELADGERAIVWFEPDLDSRLHFADELVVVTGIRVS